MKPESHDEEEALPLEKGKTTQNSSGLHFFYPSTKNQTVEKGCDDDDDDNVRKDGETADWFNEIPPPPTSQTRDPQDCSMPGAYASAAVPVFAPRTGILPTAQGASSPTTSTSTANEEHLVEACLVEDPPMAEIVTATPEASTTESPSGTSSSTSTVPTKSTKKISPSSKRLCVAGTALFVLAIVALAVAGITCGTGHCTTSSPEEEDTSKDVLDPPSATTSTTITPSLSNLPAHLLDALQDSTSPQYKAFHWLSSQTAASAVAMEEWQKIEQLVMTVVYFSNPHRKENSREKGWPNVSRSVCEWKAPALKLDCSDEGQITVLSLDGFFIQQVPRELELLSHLNSLVIESSAMTGSLQDLLPHPVVSGLHNLRRLSLKRNELLTGTIPTYIAELTQLTTLQMPRNSLTGSIPSTLGELTQLTKLALFGNQLTGPIPSHLGHLSKLEYFSAIWNDLTGSIPSQLAKLTSMRAFNLFDNHVSGPIPTELGLLSNCETLDLSKNEMTGTLPSELGLLSSLITLSLFQNRLEDTIPSQLGFMLSSQLEYLDLASNKLTGSIPSELGLLTMLTKLALYENNLSGLVPQELGNLINLEHLWLQDNESLWGVVPESVCRLTQEQDLHDFTLDCSGNLLCPEDDCTCSYCD